MAKLYVGRDIYNRAGQVTSKVDQKLLQKMLTVASKRGTKGLTVQAGRGYFYDTKGRKLYPPEQTAILTIFAPAQRRDDRAGAKCEVVRAKARGIAAELARIGRQKSVAVHVTCADGRSDVELIGRTGKPSGALAPLSRGQRGKRRGRSR